MPEIANVFRVFLHEGGGRLAVAGFPICEQEVPEALGTDLAATAPNAVAAPSAAPAPNAATAPNDRPGSERRNGPELRSGFFFKGGFFFKARRAGSVWPGGD